MAFTVNDRLARQKVELLRRNVTRAARETVQDAGAFLQMKIVNQIINSPGTAAQGAPQPPHNVAAGQYVRRRTGMLVGSTKMRPYPYGVLIFANTSIAPYAREVSEWSKRQYGHSYWELTIKMYGALTRRIFSEQILEATNQADNLKSYRHRNRFPAT